MWSCWGWMSALGIFPHILASSLMTKSEDERAQVVAKYKQQDIIAAASSMDGLLSMFGPNPDMQE